MTRINFYEKPSCINNTKQKALLQSVGHEVIAYNLLTTPWTAVTLRPFFSDRPTAEWFKKTAPQIKSGEVVPENLDEETALELMIQYPLLIRRPLIQVGNVCQTGFDLDRIDAWIGLATQKSVENLETCPRTH
ncbi:ArsC/Spx/MgsR family protein [Myxosarcina sp. GI1]|uniref:ArsC/Spx/MgsR family protein n=1 Tax=Myxosarcina sp. GI1 TaxID=1541065 RepID=UPI00056D88F4|nr:ArsC/Spx/MgsR family protein [Myxosarcina sp. GI1]